MDRQQVIATLRDYEPELKAIGVLSASVFGSVARDEAGSDSDVDVCPPNGCPKVDLCRTGLIPVSSPIR